MDLVLSIALLVFLVSATALMFALVWRVITD